MAIKIDIPGVGEVTVEGAAQESTMQQILAAVSKSDKSKRKEESARAEADKKSLDAKKKETDATKDQTSQLEKFIKRAKEEQEKYKSASKTWDTLMSDLADSGVAVKAAVKNIGVSAAGIFASMITTYDDLAKNPIQAGKGILQTVINLTSQVAKVGVDIIVAMGKAAVGWIPFIGGGLADIVGAFGDLAKQVIDFANQIATAANEVLAAEFQKRADQLRDFTKISASFAGGMTQMAALANQSGVGIVNFTAAVVASREEITAMGLDAGSATKLLSQGMGALGTAVGKGGKVVRDELMALGYDYQAQGKIMAQYMAQQRAAGANLAAIAPDTLAKQTEEYAKHLKVISDITGQDAAKLMDQARAEAQRGALLNTLNAQQTKAFQDAYATLAAMPGQQGPKLQAALAQMLAGGTVTDPVIAGNQQIMNMLQTTARQVSSGNVDMVVATQRNLANAADAYRAAGESATDFATLMNPSGTSAVAQGMSQFGNALRQYRYDPSSAEASMQAADLQAGASDGLTNTYVGLQNVMTSFQNKMESIAGDALPAYTAAMMTATEMTFKVVNAGLDLITGKASLIEIVKRFTGGSGGVSSGKADAVLPGLGGLLSGANTGVFEGKTPGTTKALSQAQGSTYNTANLSEQPPSAAAGGILEGSVAGFAATLHGTEAVVPLPENRSIPVNLDSSSLTAAMHQQTGVLTQILSTMQKNNSLTSGILQASM